MDIEKQARHFPAHFRISLLPIIFTVYSFWPFEHVKTISCKDAGEVRRLEYDLKKLTRKQKIVALDIGSASEH